MLMFRGVKLEDPSVSAFRRELLTRWQRQAAKGGALRAQADTAVTERARPAAAPSRCAVIDSPGPTAQLDRKRNEVQVQSFVRSALAEQLARARRSARRQRSRA